MHVIADLCIVPLGVGVSVSAYVVACERVLKEAGLKTHLHAYGTNIEGEWDVVMAAIKRCHEVVHAQGAPRITTTVHIGTRTDRTQHMEDKVESVRQKLSGYSGSLHSQGDAIADRD
ncbi:MAG: MTH1187 family thiamine-binding protein [Candidatus Competibacteraceae bacterium]|nr:MTH1187 family thiamine-binding protein [Candidatus Competibacteraceae bacterium]